MHRLLIVIGLNILPNAKGHLRTRLSPETWVNAWAINRDMGQCMGCQQRHGSMHGLSAETWVNAWAVNRHGSMHGLSTDMGQCMGCKQRHGSVHGLSAEHGSMHGLSAETWVNAWAINRDMGQCMGYHQTWVNAWAINRDMGQCMGYQQGHGSMLPLAGAAKSFCREKSFCFVVTSIFVSRQSVTTNTCLSQQK